jgi:hypothetical protein
VGEIFLKERAIIVLQDGTSGTLANAALALAATATLDNRTGGNAGEDFWANFELLTGFAVAPAVDVVAAELYLVPALDGTNFAEADTVYVINRSAQTMAAGWQLRVVTAREQYV